MFIVQYDGDLVRRRELLPLESFATLEDAFASLKRQFTDEKNPNNPQYTPCRERDRILIWQALPGDAVSMVVIWAFIGWHFQREGLPGIENTDDILPGIGSLFALASSAEDIDWDEDKE